ncbi:MAG TPA: tetratricopeptide repeat protein [Rectinemataceae bacterium]|nr:tetratricopeptide repeat protein [Rectinemataceae bacterium]
MDTASRSPKAKAAAEEKKHISHHVADFLRKYRVVLLGILAAVVLVIIGVAVWTAISDSRAKSSTLAIEKAEDAFSAYQAESDQTKKPELEKQLLASLDSVIKSWPHLYAAQKAYTIEAKLAEDKKDWEGAEKAWLAASLVLPTDFLAPLALQSAATAAEERGASDKAAEYYKRLVDKYNGSSIGIPHAFFALGRISEEAKDYGSAVGYYEKIVAGYPDDDWTKLAKDRILFLKSQGLLK